MDNTLRDQLQTFESFFQAIGFKQRQGRVWGLLVLEGRPKSAADIAHELQISIGSTSECLTELREWGAVKSEFSPEHRCQLHSAVSDTLGIVATVLRRREQVAVQRFMESARSALDYVNERYGEEDPRAETLASIVSTAQIADAAIQFFVSTAGHSAQS